MSSIKPKVSKTITQERLEARRQYEIARSQTPERKTYQLELHRKNYAKRVDLGLCRDCGKLPIEGQTRCEACRDKHKADGRRRNAERREQKQQG